MLFLFIFLFSIRSRLTWRTASFQQLTVRRKHLKFRSSWQKIPSSSRWVSPSFYPLYISFLLLTYCNLYINLFTLTIPLYWPVYFHLRVTCYCCVGDFLWFFFVLFTSLPFPLVLYLFLYLFVYFLYLFTNRLKWMV